MKIIRDQLCFCIISQLTRKKNAYNANATVQHKRRHQPSNEMKHTLIFLLATLTSAFNPYILQTYRFPHSSFASGQRYIHSPEHFLPTHGIVSGPNFALRGTTPPVLLQDYWLTELSYRTAWDLGSVRVFTQHANISYFMLMTDRQQPSVMGQIRVRPLDRGGFALRCFAQRIRPSGIWEMLLGGAREPAAVLVESMVHASGCVGEDENLKEYRRLVLRNSV